MALIFKRILLVTHNVQFAIDTKRALESLGEYEVTTVTDASNALDRLRDQPHHLVILDVENLALPAPEMIGNIRDIQEEIAIVLAPDLPDVHDVARVADVQGVVDIPMPVRALIPLIENSVQDVYDNLPDTAKAPPVDVPSETVYIETLVDDLLGDDETPYFTSRQIRAQLRGLIDENTEATSRETEAIEVIIESTSEGDTMRYVESDSDDRSIQLFQKLANEEPPMPDFQESGTVSDLARTATRSQLLEMLRADDDEAETEARQPSEESDEDDYSSQPAILVLKTALDETTPVHAISLEKLLENIQSRLPEDKQNIRPLPSWLKESKKFVTEPLFLQENLPSLDSQRPIEYTSSLTQPSEGALVVDDPGSLDTEVLESNYPHAPEDVEDIVDLSELDEDAVEVAERDEPEAEVVEADDLDTPPSEKLEAEPVVDETIEDVPDTVAEEPQVIEPEPDILLQVDVDDPYLTQLAVTLTQVTTELTAEATILTRDNVIVAYSGEMPIEDIEDIREVIDDDWGSSAESSRIRFITLPSSGRDYMLYSKGTVGGFTLSMAFAGTKQLRVIRRQGERLLGALEAVPDEEGSDDTPEMVAEPEALTQPDKIVAEPDVLDDKPSQEIRPIPTFDDTPDDDIKPMDVGPKQPFTFVWLVDSFEVQLSEHVGEQLVFWLEVQLNGLYWTIHKLEVHQDFIYLFADIPGDPSPSELIRNLMERSRKIARSEDESLPEKLWADAYLVLTPGREMTDREIQRFLNFGRGEL